MTARSGGSFGLIITCGTLAGAIIPELVKVFTSVESSHVSEVVTASQEGGASLNILAGFVAGNFSAYWLGLSDRVADVDRATASARRAHRMSELMLAPAVFAFGLVAFGFLGMGPVTIAVDSYGPVTDNAQSVFELSVIETIPGVKDELKRDFGFTARASTRRRTCLEENDGAGQHVQGDGEAGPDRNRGRRRDDDDLLDHRGARRRA